MPQQNDPYGVVSRVARTDVKSGEFEDGALDPSADTTSAAAFASAILENREEILERWSAMLEVDQRLPAGAYILDQLDASILAFAGWFLNSDPGGTSMATKWVEIRPTRDLIAGAVTAFGMFPEAVRVAKPSRSVIQIDRLAEYAVVFAREMISWILEAARFDVDDERWQNVANEIEERYHDQRLRRVQRLGVLIDIAHAVSTVGDLEQLFDHVYRAIARVFDCDFTEISIVDPTTETLRTNLLVLDGQRRHDLENQFPSYGLANEVLRVNEGLIAVDYVRGCEERGFRPNDLLDDGLQRAWMGSPLRTGEQTVGVIAVSCQLRSFEQEDLELLDAVSRQASVALENRQLIEAQRRSLIQLKAINKLAREIATIRDLRELLDTSARLICELFEFRRVEIYLVDDESGALDPAQASSYVPGKSGASDQELRAPEEIAKRVLASSEPVLESGDAQSRASDARFTDRFLRSEIAVPILYSGEIIGVLFVQTHGRCPYMEHDISTLQAAAEQIAVTIESCRLFLEESRRSRELKLVLQTSRAVGGSLQLDEVLNHLADGLTEATGANWCQVHLFDRDAAQFWPVAFRRRDQADNGEFPDKIQSELPLGDHGELQQVLEDRHPFLVCCLALTDRSNPTCNEFLIVPLHARNSATGLAILPAGLDTGLEFPNSRIRLIQGIADSSALAIENARLYARSHGLAIAEERGRLAQQIHDTIAQGLTAIALQLDLADSYLPSRPEQASVNVKRALELTRINLNEARRSVLDLQASDVHEMSLPDAMTQLLRRFGETTGIDWDFRNQGTSDRLSARVEVGLYRIVEEALENVRRHSGARHVQVTLTTTTEQVSIEIDDNGAGFEPESAVQGRPSCAGFGLVGIRERARLLGGMLSITSTPGLGTSVCVTVPFEPRKQAGSSIIATGGAN